MFDLECTCTWCTLILMFHCMTVIVINIDLRNVCKIYLFSLRLKCCFFIGLTTPRLTAVQISICTAGKFLCMTIWRNHNLIFKSNELSSSKYSPLENKSPSMRLIKPT